MFKILKFLVFIIILLALVVLNPNKEAHQKAIQADVKSKNVLAGMLGGGWLKSKAVKYDSYYLFSTTKIGDRLMSIGVATYVWTGDLDLDSKELKDLRKKVEKSVDKAVDTAKEAAEDAKEAVEEVIDNN